MSPEMHQTGRSRLRVVTNKRALMSRRPALGEREFSVVCVATIPPTLRPEQHKASSGRRFGADDAKDARFSTLMACGHPHRAARRKARSSSQTGRPLAGFEGLHSTAPALLRLLFVTSTPPPGPEHHGPPEPAVQRRIASALLPDVVCAGASGCGAT